jgi:hypothetical protein
VLYLISVCLQGLSKVPGSWSSHNLRVCPSRHLGSQHLVFNFAHSCLHKIVSIWWNTSPRAKIFLFSSLVHRDTLIKICSIVNKRVAHKDSLKPYLSFKLPTFKQVAFACVHHLEIMDTVLHLSTARGRWRTESKSVWPIRSVWAEESFLSSIIFNRVSCYVVQAELKLQFLLLQLP